MTERVTTTIYVKHWILLKKLSRLTGLRLPNLIGIAVEEMLTRLAVELPQVDLQDPGVQLPIPTPHKAAQQRARRARYLSGTRVAKG